MTNNKCRRIITAQCTSDENNKKNTLRANFPTIFNEWHPIKNSNLNANDITDGSSRKVWWVCENGHEWEAIVKNRTKHGRGCPYCAGQLATADNNFAKTFPEKLNEWHPTKNGFLSP